MSDPPQPSTVDRIELMIAVVLSIAALLTSWANFQAGLWDGEQAADYGRANNLRVEASTTAMESDARTAVAINLFNAWLTAAASGDERLAEFYRTRFPPELRAPFDAWIKTRPLQNPDAPLSPFARGGVPRPGQLKADQLNRQADAEFAAGEKANAVSDMYTQADAFFAVAMFCGGIAQVFRLQRVKVLLLSVAIAATAAAVWRLTGLPIMKPG